MTVLEALLRIYIEDNTFVLVFLTFYFTLPSDLASFTPVRFNVSAEHVLLDRVWCDKRFPNLTLYRFNRSCGFGYQVLAHDFRPFLMPGLSLPKSEPFLMFLSGRFEC